MSQITAVATHCPECGATATRHRDDDGYEYELCPNDECDRIVVSCVSYRRPADDDRAGGRNTLTRFADGDRCTP